MEITKPEPEIPGMDNYSRTLLSRIFALDTLKICLIYLVFGILWILFSDNVFLSLAKRQEDIIFISSIKGILFIVVTTILLFLLIRHFSSQLKEKNEQLQQQYEVQKKAEEELRASYKQIAASEEELRAQYDMLAESEQRIRESEQKFREFIDMGPFIFVVNDLEGHYLLVNKAFEELSGYPSSEVLGKTSVELGLIEYNTFKEMIDHLKKAGHIDGYGSVTRARDGTVRNILISSRFVIIGGKPLMISAVLDITESVRSQKSLEQAKKKLNLLNYVTFNDIQNLTFSLTGYIQLARDRMTDEPLKTIIDKEADILQKITQSLKFAQTYQNLGLKPSKWQNTRQVFLLAISHLDFLNIQHTITLDGLEMFADPMLEQVFQILADNILTHGKTATRVMIHYTEGPDSLTVFFEDNGAGIPGEAKEWIFSPDFQKTKSVGLFLAREILEITGISIMETGIPGEGARFEMTVPKEAYRFTDTT